MIFKERQLGGICGSFARSLSNQGFGELASGVAQDSPGLFFLQMRLKIEQLRLRRF